MRGREGAGEMRANDWLGKDEANGEVAQMTILSHMADEAAFKLVLK